MTITLTPQESEQYFHNALCNGLSTFQMSGITLGYDEYNYDTAKTKLTNPCYEDVLMQILRDGNKLVTIDMESNINSNYNRVITLQDVHNKVQNTPLAHLSAMIDEVDDAETADVILQTVFFDEIVFG